MPPTTDIYLYLSHLTLHVSFIWSLVNTRLRYKIMRYKMQDTLSNIPARAQTLRTRACTHDALNILFTGRVCCSPECRIAQSLVYWSLDKNCLMLSVILLLFSSCAAGENAAASSSVCCARQQDRVIIILHGVLGALWLLHVNISRLLFQISIFKSSRHASYNIRFLCTIK